MKNEEWRVKWTNDENWVLFYHKLFSKNENTSDKSQGEDLELWQEAEFTCRYARDWQLLEF